MRCPRSPSALASAASSPPFLLPCAASAISAPLGALRVDDAQPDQSLGHTSLLQPEAQDTKSDQRGFPASDVATEDSLELSSTTAPGSTGPGESSTASLSIDSPSTDSIDQSTVGHLCPEQSSSDSGFSSAENPWKVPAASTSAPALPLSPPPPPPRPPPPLPSADVVTVDGEKRFLPAFLKRPELLGLSLKDARDFLLTKEFYGATFADAADLKANSAFLLHDVRVKLLEAVARAPRSEAPSNGGHEERTRERSGEGVKDPIAGDEVEAALPAMLPVDHHLLSLATVGSMAAPLVGHRMTEAKYGDASGDPRTFLKRVNAAIRVLPAPPPDPLKGVHPQEAATSRIPAGLTKTPFRWMQPHLKYSYDEFAPHRPKNVPLNVAGYLMSAELKRGLAQKIIDPPDRYPCPVPIDVDLWAIPPAEEAEEAHGVKLKDLVYANDVRIMRAELTDLLPEEVDRVAHLVQTPVELTETERDRRAARIHETYRKILSKWDPAIECVQNRRELVRLRPFLTNIRNVIKIANGKEISAIARAEVARLAEACLRRYKPKDVENAKRIERTLAKTREREEEKLKAKKKKRVLTFWDRVRAFIWGLIPQ